MAYPYKKMTEEDFEYIRSVTSFDRVWTGKNIATEYYRDEMPEYGVFPPELYVEVLNKEEISAIMAYAYKENIPVVCRGAGTWLAGGATCKYGGIMLSVMRMNHIFPVDHKNQTITAEPGALLIDIQAAASAEGLFYPLDPGEKTASIGGNVITNAGGMKAVRYGLTRDFVRCIEAVMPDGSIMNFSSNVVKNTTGYDIKDLVIGSEGTLCILTQVTLKLLPAPVRWLCLFTVWNVPLQFPRHGTFYYRTSGRCFCCRSGNRLRANAYFGSTGRWNWRPNTNHFHLNHFGCDFHRRKYDFRYCYQMCKCCRKKYDIRKEIAGTPCQKCRIYSDFYIFSILNCSVWTDDSCQKRIRISWICCADYTVHTILDSCNRNERKRNLIHI